MQDDIAMALLAQFQSEEFEGEVGSCGQLWAVVGSCGQLWAVVGSCGQLWAVVGSWHGHGEHARSQKVLMMPQ